MPPLLELEFIVAVNDAQLLVDAQILIVEEPLAIPRRVKVLLDRFACTALGFELDAT